jgi:predicted DNA-binding protein
MENGWKNILVSLPVRVYEKLRELSRAMGTPMTQLVRTAILEFLRKIEQEKEVKK